MPSSDDDKTNEVQPYDEKENKEKGEDEDKELSNLLSHDFRFNCQLISSHVVLLPKY